MHCYEVIPEKDACKLYFDLEFYKPANPGADGKSMVAKLIEVNWSHVVGLYEFVVDLIWNQSIYHFVL